MFSAEQRVRAVLAAAFRLATVGKFERIPEGAQATFAQGNIRVLSTSKLDSHTLLEVFHCGRRVAAFNGENNEFDIEDPPAEGEDWTLELLHIAAPYIAQAVMDQEHRTLN